MNTRRVRSTFGRPLLGTDVTIVDEEGEPLGDGEVGEIVVAGPTVTPGYLGDPDTTAAAFGAHGLHTGDAGYRDDGLLWVTGRIDPRTIRFADEIPRTASGTVDREAVRERLR